MACISIDWLQLHVKISPSGVLDGLFTPNGAFGIIPKEVRHNVFRKHREIYSNLTGSWEPCAVISWDAHSGILPADSGHIKVINKFLYQSELENLVDQLLRQLSLKFVSVSRYDIAYDFYRFADVSPPVFIKQFLSKKYLKRLSCKFSVEGSATASMPVHYLRFGTKNSPAQWYLYNKSKELREVKDKPYIRERWALNGLNSKSKDVWRIEFSLHPSKFGLVDTDAGHIIPFDEYTITDFNFARDLFFTLVDRYAQFVFNDGQKRKERMKPVRLFKQKDQGAIIYQRISDKGTSNRMDKVFIKKLHELNDAWRAQSNSSPTVSDLLQSVIESKDLQQWFNEQMISSPEKQINEILQSVTSKTTIHHD